MASGLVAGCWVFLAGTMPFAKYTNREKSKGEVATCPSRVPPPLRSRTPTIRSSYPGENIQIATLSQCERRLLPNPFDRIQWASIFKFIWRRFLFLQPFLARPSPVLLSSFSLSRSPLFAFFFPATKTVTRNRCELPGVGKGTGKKEFASRSFFFSFRPSVVDTRGLDLERKPRRQMRTSARGNCLSSIFRAVFPSPEDLDLEKRDGVALQGTSMWTWVLKQIQCPPIFIEMRYENCSDLIDKFHDWPKITCLVFHSIV